MLTKEGGYGLAGGISVNHRDEVPAYYKYCVELHKKRNPNIKVLDMYVGEKEIVNQGQDRNYLYHINEISDNVWGVVLGKFSLMFSLAPEFVRWVLKNPPRVHPVSSADTNSTSTSSNAFWIDIVNENKA